MADLSRLCIHQVTLLEQCDFRQSIECFARNQVFATAVWRDKLAEINTSEAAQILNDHNMTVVALCAGGFLTEREPAAFQQALNNNRRWLEQAAAIQAGTMVTICGGMKPGETDLRFARDRALEGINKLLPDARAAGVKIAFEPLHPMVCGLRSVVCTLRDANDWLDLLNADDIMRLAIDTYAIWWEPELEQEIQRAGKRIACFHVSDWLPDTQDVRLDRGMPGDGLIDIPLIRSWVDATGYDSYCEVEIFSARNWWKRDPDEVVRIIKERFVDKV